MSYDYDFHWWWYEEGQYAVDLKEDQKTMEELKQFAYKVYNLLRLREMRIAKCVPDPYAVYENR